MKHYFFSILLGLSTVNSFAADNDNIKFEVRSSFGFSKIEFTIPKDNAPTWQDVRAATYNKLMDLKKDKNLSESYMVSMVKYHNNIGLVHSDEIVTSFSKLNELVPSFEGSQPVTLHFVARKIGEYYWQTHKRRGLQPEAIKLENERIVDTLQHKWINERSYINDNNLVYGVNKVLLNPKPSYTRAAIIRCELSSEAITEIQEMTKEFYPDATESNPVVEYVKDFLES